MHEANNLSDIFLEYSRPQSKETRDIKRSLKLMFNELAVGNDKLEKTLLKVSAINQLYNANLFYPIQMARHITLIPSLDSMIRDGHPDAVSRIAVITINERQLNCYSFATKYCHFENQESYPIFDSYVEKALLDFSRKRLISKYTKQALHDYSIFIEAIDEVKRNFNLFDKSLNEIDAFLWNYGKRNFPNKY